MRLQRTILEKRGMERKEKSMAMAFPIFLHKHLFDNAIAVLKTATRYTLLAQVVDAALEEQTALDWVIQALPAEHIMNDLFPGSGSLAHKSTYGLFPARAR